METDAELSLFGDEDISARAAQEQRRYVNNFIGSKQKLIDFIWFNTSDGVKSDEDRLS